MLAGGVRVVEYSSLAGGLQTLGFFGIVRLRCTANCLVLFQVSLKTPLLRNDVRVFINNSDECLAPIAEYDIFCRALANSSHGPKIKDKDSRAKTVSNFQSFVSYPRRAARLS